MQQYFSVDAKEKKQELLMLAFSILACLTIAKGVYNQFHNIDQDYFLVPFIMAMFTGYFLVYGINGITKGNLLPKWTPSYIFQFICFLARKVGSMPKERARMFTTKLLGTISLIISVVIFTMGIFQMIHR